MMLKTIFLSISLFCTNKILKINTIYFTVQKKFPKSEINKNTKK